MVIQKKERNVSLDLLRVIAMMMIVTLHCLAKGNVLSIQTPSIKIFAWTLEAFCIVAVNVYVLISGYFLIDSKFKIKKVLCLWGEVLFYSISLLIISKIFGVSIGLKNTIYCLFPVLTKVNYWFVTIYLLMYILSPFVNILINHMSKREHFNLIMILIVIFSIISLVLPYNSLIDNTNGTGIIWFIILYFVSTYIKKYVKVTREKNLRNLILYVLFSLCIVGSMFFVEFIGNLFGHPGLVIERFYLYSTIFVFLASLFLFLFFRNIEIENSFVKRVVIFLSPLTFGVYLIHEHVLVRSVIYNNIFNFANYQEFPLPLFIFIIFLSVFVIYIVCSLIEYIRIVITKHIKNFKIVKFFIRFVDFVIEKTTAIFELIYKKI